jgi:hypothetical protein
MEALLKDRLGDHREHHLGAGETDQLCRPMEIGAHVRIWEGTCWRTAGIPLWRVVPAIAGRSLRPVGRQPFTGTRLARRTSRWAIRSATGSRQP